MSRKNSLPPLNEQEIIDAYLLPDSNSAAVCAQFHIGKKRLREIMLAHGIPMRKPGMTNVGSSVDKRKEKFIAEAKAIDGNECIDYSQVEYVNNRTPVKLIDRSLRPDGTEYGEFWQTPSNHLKGQGHPDKRAAKISSALTLTQEEVIARFMEVHKGEKLDYSQVEYRGMHDKVKIICRELDADGNEYGEFWQEPVVHLKGCTHPQLAIDRNAYAQRSNTEEFIEKAKKVHADHDYDYSKVDYVNNRDKICVICNKANRKGKIHGEFWISPDNFLQGKGCPRCGCSISRKEEEIAELIRQNGLEVVQRDRQIIKPLELDIVVPSKRVAIEYNGIRWHAESDRKPRTYHLDKTERCLAAGYRLIQIFEDEYINHKEIVQEKILQALGLRKDAEKIPARKCSVREIDGETASAFLDANHLQGRKRSTLYLGAYFGDRLVGVMSLVRTARESEDWELARYATPLGCHCQGLGSKMFAHFVREFRPNSVKSFADRRWTPLGIGNLYTKMGFALDGKVAPSYSYYMPSDPINRHHKFGFRKEILSKEHGLPMTMTETEMTQSLGYVRIWDSGLWKYVWTPVY